MRDNDTSKEQRVKCTNKQLWNDNSHLEPEFEKKSII